MPDRDEVVREMYAAFKKSQARGYPEDGPNYPDKDMRAALLRGEELGWKLTPREPSEEMILAGGETEMQDNGYDDAKVIWQAMYDKAE